MSCENCEESAYVIERMGKLLAEIAIVVNGPEPPLTRWSYHDLPARVRALKQAQQPAAAVPDGYALVPVADLESLAFTDFGRAFWTDGAEAAALRIRALLAAPAAAVPADDAIEAAYWDFDARHKGYGPHKATPQSERDAFKWAVRALLAAVPPAALAVPARYVPLAAAEALALEAMRVGNLGGHERTVEGHWSAEVGDRFEEFMFEEGFAMLAAAAANKENSNG